ncbi:hypothetical protein C0J52_27053, partial [Blattella germanica]
RTILDGACVEAGSVQLLCPLQRVIIGAVASQHAEGGSCSAKHRAVRPDMVFMCVRTRVRELTYKMCDKRNSSGSYDIVPVDDSKPAVVARGMPRRIKVVIKAKGGTSKY